MRHDPIEFGLTNASARMRRSTTMSKSARGGVIGTVDLPTADVIDEAFAGLEEFNSNAGSWNSPGNHGHALNKALVANLAAQLNALDHQREQLAQLLRNVDTSTNAD
jgi:hypothetical protein